MADKLTFKVSAALKDIIGKDLITDDNIAVFELVKNAYDAYATRVDIYFENIYDDNSKIIIKDNGKGMDKDDLKNRWLFVAYSAKRDGTEDESFDYRDNIYQKRPFAGAKGIGRFSCDRLGSHLRLETTKKRKGTKTEILITDWEEFEGDLKDEFVAINVLHKTKKKTESNGTILEISGLRSDWDRWKLLKLKDSLAKLINPSRGKGEHNFKIVIHVPEEKENDKLAEEDYEVVNGEVGNFIFETLGLKTTKINACVSNDGKYITTGLYDGGTLIYKIKEHNPFQLLDSIEYTLFYLNQSAKLTFARRMGLPSVRYGHVFLYKNGFRIYPYGEPGEDPLKVDVRKAQGYSRFLGNRELMGQIEIFSQSNQLKETSSRGDGLIKTQTFQQLEDCFWQVLKRMEKYVVDVQQWGLSIEDEGSANVKSRSSELIAKLSGSDEIIDFEVSDSFYEILEASQANSAETIVNNLNKIALESGDDELIEEAKKASAKLTDIQIAREEAERQAEEELKRAQEATEKLKEQISENLFLKSINASDYEEVISLLHHIGIYAGTIDNNLKGIALRVQNEIPLNNEDLYNIVKSISFETKKILNVVAFATKAKFKLKTEKIEVDINSYITEYLQNIIPTVTDKTLKLQVDRFTDKEFKKTIKPIELNIVIDNIINNAKKAKADTLVIEIDENDDGGLSLRFIDNGTGIKKAHLPKIYDLGFTTTDGSGIGLYHVKGIMGNMKGIVRAENNEKGKGATFTIEFN